MTRAIPYILIVLLAFSTTAAVVTRPKDSAPVVSLADRINSACKPLPVNDWWIDPNDGGLIRVSCYDPKTANLTYTVVDR